MLRIRIASIGALAAIAIASAGTAASAQDAAMQPGKPLALLAGLNPPHESKNKQAKSHVAKAHAAKAAVHSKTAHARTHHAKPAKLADKTATKQGSAVAADEQTAAPPATTVPDNKWPVPRDPAAQDPAAQDLSAQANAPANAGAAPSVAAAAPTTGDSDMSAVVVNGQTVQISSPDAVNDIDRAAASPSASPAQNVAAQPADQQSADTGTPTPATTSDTDLQPAMARAAVVAMSSDSEAVSNRSEAVSNGSGNIAPADARAGAGPVGSASWIAQVLAALGGAVAAGAVAWFLIGSGPLRTYG